MHKRKGMAVRVTEERHPEVMILHGRDKVGLVCESYATLLKFADGECDIRTTEVDRRTVGNVPRLPCLFQQQPDPAAIEECQVTKAIQPSWPRPNIRVTRRKVAGDLDRQTPCSGS
jgi:hypothetical protein